MFKQWIGDIARLSTTQHRLWISIKKSKFTLEISKFNKRRTQTWKLKSKTKNNWYGKKNG